MVVRFKKQYAETTNGRLSYELIDDELVFDFNEKSQQWYDHYNTKLLGLVPAYMMEEADGSEVEAIDVFVKLPSK